MVSLAHILFFSDILCWLFLNSYFQNSEPVHCGGSVLKSAQNVSRKKTSLDETGLEYCVCRHGVVQQGVNMFRERFLRMPTICRKNLWLKIMSNSCGMMSSANIGHGWYHTTHSSRMEWNLLYQFFMESCIKCFVSLELNPFCIRVDGL